MFTVNRRTRVFVCKEPTHLRASYDTLFEKVKKVLIQDPTSGHLFVFVNLRRTSCKCFYYDGTGFVIIGLCRSPDYADPPLILAVLEDLGLIESA